MLFTFVTDPLTSIYGAVKPAVIVGKELNKMGHEVSFVSTQISEKAKEELSWANVTLIKRKTKVGNSLFSSIPILREKVGNSLFSSIPILRDWMKAMILPSEIEVEGDVVVNSSSSVLVNSTVYYGQGQITKALDDIVKAKDFPWRYRIVYNSFGPIFRRLEMKHVNKLRGMTSFFIANSNYSRKLYESWSIKVDDVIYPPVDDTLFRPTTNPEGDYVVTYVGVEGKETDLEVLRRLSDAGVKVKAFGRMKVEKQIGKNVEFLGFVDEKKLVDLYSNALFTLVVFNHEPFGYVPIESMACGTPVLSYNKQGPSESVCEKCGWLVASRDEMIKKAIEIWKKGYDPKMRINAMMKSKRYSKDSIVKQWLCLIKEEKVEKER
ncbi:D-inositol-3-phosphate glycosyltransferase [Sulfuracidifex tepidarius]|uniref:D-inositol-3-phosphate glycosyltransferase n=1 Tax=Sulfuracidifex tepidarius TaxID=1294262 RepID=A0A510DRN6_9CREN|nr:glycosyltransferase [Sulfuracidifex tepidarius]BBG22824.1 D-inositol-3-phosphate glycosyltransferase [Sulfuracidifex tepidarius]